MDEYKYEAAIEVLSGLPERLKTSRVRDLLLDAMDLKKQFDGLLAAVEKDLASYEHPERLFRKARRLMQLRPNHRRVREIFAQVSGAKSKLPLRVRRSWQKGQFYLIAGKTVHLSVLVGIFLGIAGAVTAGLWSVFLYVPTEDGLVQIEIADPTLSVKVDGNSFTVANLKSPLAFSTGNHKLIIDQDGRQLSTSSFTVTEGKTLRLRVSLLAGELVLENNGVPKTLPMEIQSRPPPNVVATVEGAGRPNLETHPVTPKPGVNANDMEPVVTNSIGMKLRLIPAGEFMMGSRISAEDTYRKYKYTAKENLFKNEHPLHRVRITNPFRVGATEVTQHQWETVMGTRPWVAQKSVKAGPNYPVSVVSWHDAQDFCRKLSEKEGAEYRLPTEAEWEYACRAGTTSLYSYSEGRLKDYAWYQNASNTLRHAHLVGTRKPNPWQLYDMHGNVFEWSQDWYHGTYYDGSPVDNPQGPGQGEEKVFRGGGWGSTQELSRSAHRRAWLPDLLRSYLGFRVVRNLPDKPIVRPQPNAKRVAPPVAVPAGSILACQKLSTNAAPVGLHPDAAAFTFVYSTENGYQQKGFQLPLPGWKAWSGNEWQFELRQSGPLGGCYLIHPLRFGHFTLLVRPDDCPWNPDPLWKTRGRTGPGGSPVTIPASTMYSRISGNSAFSTGFPSIDSR